MIAIADVPIPERMARLARDARGYPVPFVVLVQKDGKPLFTVNDSSKALVAIHQDRCAICGQRLLRGRWFAGGPGAALHPRGCYIDTAMHRECMEYAMKVCPYHAAPRYEKRIDDLKVDYSQRAPEDRILADPTMIVDRPPLFVCVHARAQSVEVGSTGFVIRPSRPYISMQFWRQGQRLPDDEGRRLAEAQVARLIAEGQAPGFAGAA